VLRVAGVLAAVTLACAPAGSARSSITITVQSAAGAVVRVAHPPAGERGDVLFSSLALLDSRTGAKVGTMDYTLTIVKACRSVITSCQTRARVVAVTTFRDGTIRAVGPWVSISRPTIVVHIRNGTGRYAGARGTLTFGPSSTRTNVYALSLP
jgi:hypothetical protein